MTPRLARRSALFPHLYSLFPGNPRHDLESGCGASHFAVRDQIFSLGTTNSSPCFLVESAGPGLRRGLMHQPSSGSSPQVQQGPRPAQLVAHTEAQSVFYHNLSLHISDPLLFEAVVSDRLPKKGLKPEILRSLSFCLRIKLDYDTDKGYSFATDVDHQGKFWSRYHPGLLSLCSCIWCCANTRFPEDGTELDRHFPNVKEVRLRTYFTCRERHYNYRLTIPRRELIRLRNGGLVWPVSPSPWVWTGDRGRIKALFDDLWNSRPLGVFKGGQSKSVVVDFATRCMEHNLANELPHLHDACWYMLSVDLRSIPRASVTEAITAQISGAEGICLSDTSLGYGLSSSGANYTGISRTH